MHPNDGRGHQCRRNGDRERNEISTGPVCGKDHAGERDRTYREGRGLRLCPPEAKAVQIGESGVALVLVARRKVEEPPRVGSDPLESDHGPGS